VSQIPIIGQKPQLPPTLANVGSIGGNVLFQFGPPTVLSIEDARTIVAGLSQAIAAAEMERAQMTAAVQSNGDGAR
jgi:hypothetical protein